MHKTWTIARNEIEMTLQGWRSGFYLLLLPVLVIYLVGLGTQRLSGSLWPTIRVDVLDQDRSPASATLVAALAESNEALLVCPQYNDPADACGLADASLTPELAQARLFEGTTDAALIIPGGFAAALAGETGKVTLRFESGASLAAPDVAYAALLEAVTRMGGPVTAARMSTQFAQSRGVETGPAFYAGQLAKAAEFWGDPPPVQVKTELSRPNEKLDLGAQLLENGFKVSTPGIALTFVMISVLGLAQSLAEERMRGILRRVMAMPVSRAQVLGGKLLAAWLVGWTQFVVLLAFGTLLGVDFGSAPLATILVAGAFVLAATALALALAAWTRTAGQASALATFAWVALVPLGGGWWPLAYVPAWMRTLGHLSPVAWCMDALNALIFHGGTLADVLPAMGVLLLFAAAFFAAGVKQLDFHRAGGDGLIQALPYFGVDG